MWKGILPEDYFGNEPSFSERPGGFDPKARIDEMAVDGVSAEVLYPSIAMKLFGLEDAQLQRRALHRYNEWLAEYCSANPHRLLGIGLVPAWDMDDALAEVSWCADNKMRGVQVWQTPPAHLRFDSGHYEPLFEACADTGLPLNLHIITGFGMARTTFEHGTELVKTGTLLFKVSITQKLHEAQDALLEIVLSGALDRHPGLRVILVENECAWLPFFFDQLDYYYRRFEGKGPISLERPPSQALRDQVFTTFFRDPNVAATVRALGTGNLMWSSDYPHGNSTWPESRRVVQERLGGFPEPDVHRLVWTNAATVFGIDLSPADHVEA